MSGNIALKPGQKAAIVGGFQSGKTTFARQLLAAQPRTAIYDTIHEFGRHGVVCRTLRALGDAVQRDFAHVVYQPPKSQAGDRAQLEDFIKIASRSRKRMLAADEMHVFWESGDRNVVPPALSHHIRYGHKPEHGENGFLAITHRVADVPKLLFMAHHLFMFCTKLPHDTKALEGFVGKDVAREVAQLPPHHFIHAELLAGGEVRRFGPLPRGA